MRRSGHRAERGRAVNKPSPRGDVLLTGATGFLGMELLARFLEKGARTVIVPVRAASDLEARRRIDDTLFNVFGEAGVSYRTRVEPIAADLTQPRLGMSEQRLDALAERSGLIVHSAAAVSFAQSLSCAREVNTEGTRRMLSFARHAMQRGGLARYVQVSTAFVAGTHPGRFGEDDLQVGQGFRNAYEQSKFEAELLIRTAEDLPVTVLRPSIVVGDRQSGWTAAFNVIYWPLRALARGLLESVPALPRSPVDVVSVDYVADAIHALAHHPEAVGGTYHLTAGARASSIGEIATLASHYFGRPAPELVEPSMFAATASTALRQRVLDEAVAYFPYFCVETKFDDARSRALLEPLGIQASQLRDYLDRLLDFAVRCRWGKQAVSRAGARQARLAA